MFLLFICKYTFSRIADYYYIGMMNTGVNLPDSRLVTTRQTRRTKTCLDEYRCEPPGLPAGDNQADPEDKDLS